MIDFLHLPKPQNGYIDYFLGSSTLAGGTWSQVWNKPRGISFIKIIVIGAGGGGGGGFSSATTTARGGGGAGGSGSISTVMMPAIFLPDRLYVSVAIGTLGQPANNSASSANQSFVSIAPDNGAIYRVCSASGGGGGNTGTSLQGGSGAPGGTAQIISSNLQAGQGNFTAISGQSGANGGTQTGAVGTSITYPTTGLLLSGGAGGAGGAAFAGGDITAPASQSSTYTIFPTLAGGVAGTADSLAGGDGAAGINNMELLLFTGGSGGGSGFDGTAGSVGGRGGNGGIGCGGGGGGAGTTGGRGGDGGPGLVVISCW